MDEYDKFDALNNLDKGETSIDEVEAVRAQKKQNAQDSHPQAKPHGFKSPEHSQRNMVSQNMPQKNQTRNVFAERFHLLKEQSSVGSISHQNRQPNKSSQFVEGQRLQQSRQRAQNSYSSSTVGVSNRARSKKRAGAQKSEK